MFDFSALLDADVKNSCYEVALLSGEKFVIQRLNGTDFSNFISNYQQNGLTSELIVKTLSTNVFYGDDPVPIREKRAKMLLDKLPSVARELTMLIFSETAEYNEGLSLSLSESEKN